MSQRKLYPVELPPGMYNNGTEYQSRNRWLDGHLVRFLNGTIQPVGGWAAQTYSVGSFGAGEVPRKAVPFRFSGGAEYILVGTTSRLLQIVENGGAYEITDITPAGYVPVVGAWSMVQFGDYLVAVDADEGVLYQWTTPVANPATAIGGSAPTGVAGVAATAERFLLAWKGRTIYWASQESLTDWTDSATNTAGSFEIQTAGTITAVVPVRGGTLILTTVDAWLMTYIGGTFVHAFTRVGDNCGILSPNAAVAVDTGVYWMGKDRAFVYDGFVRPIPCDVMDYLRLDMYPGFLDTLWALLNPRFNELTWFYASESAAGGYPDKYVTYNFVEQHWAFGGMSRACGIIRVPLQTEQMPGLFGADGTFYYHEQDAALYPGSLLGGPWLRSGPLEVGDGDRIMEVQKIIPDVLNLGDSYVDLGGKRDPTDSAGASQTLFVNNEEVDARVSGRQFQIRISMAPTVTSVSLWRFGRFRVEAIVKGRR